MTAHTPLTVATVHDYLAAAGLAAADEPMTVRELSGGVSSLVILVETARQRLVVKQALPKLRVQADWPSRPDRSSVEVAALRACAALLPPGAVPRVLHDDPAIHAFVMTAAPAEARNWKTLLLSGQADPALARRAGALLATMHLGSAADPATAARFDDREFFHTLRVDPYLWEVCRVHPDLRATIGPLVEDILAHRQALVHGDYSPKNMLVHGGDLLILDHEVAHWGDPAFDLAFCLNHFLLKSIVKAPASAPYLALADAFWAGYAPALAIEPAGTLLPRTLLLHGGLMLARIDGKSPVEYITDAATKDLVRGASRQILAARPTDLAETVAIVRAALAAAGRA
jgi:5-methylthioribose kinase